MRGPGAWGPPDTWGTELAAGQLPGERGNLATRLAAPLRGLDYLMSANPGFAALTRGYIPSPPSVALLWRYANPGFAALQPGILDPRTAHRAVAHPSFAESARVPPGGDERVHDGHLRGRQHQPGCDARGRKDDVRKRTSRCAVTVGGEVVPGRHSDLIHDSVRRLRSLSVPPQPEAVS